MEKNQIYIKCGTNYKEMTKELLETCRLSELIGFFRRYHPSGDRGRNSGISENRRLF